MAIPSTAHGSLDVVVAAESHPVIAVELGNLVRTDYHLALWPALPDGYKKGRQHQVSGHCGSYRPSNCLAGEQVNDHSQVKPALRRGEVGYVHHSDKVRCRDRELLV